MNFKPIASYIEENITALRLGKTLFINQMPAAVEFGALLKESYSGTEIDGYITSLRKGRFQLAVRGGDYQKAHDLAVEVSTILSVSNLTLDGMLIYTLRPLNEPSAFSLSSGNNFEFLVNFSIVYGIFG